MSRVAVLAAGAAAAAAVAVAGCGGIISPDLFALSRTGAPPGARLTLVVRDDGVVHCDAVGRRLADPMLLEARALRRDLAPVAGRGLRLAPGPRSVLRYRVRSEDGSAAWSDTSRGQPPVLYRLALFERRVAQQVCGLPR